MMLLGLLIWGNALIAQYSEKMTRPLYFDTYKDIAIREMQRSGVPASITLAQGALESADGNSRLARNGNNHFGIKCHNDWNGKKIFEDDDARNECFRKYPSAEDSYRDHSDYLRSKSRYAFLFDLNMTDYKAWARGLKKAGYATNSNYAESLIRIIEEHNLSLYDRMVATPLAPEKARREPVVATRAVLEKNRVKYILAKRGETFESVTLELGKLSWELLQYNDVREADSLAQGQVVYIQPKRNKAEAGKNVHIVKEGETMYTISQLYAVKLDRLYLMNNMNPGTRPSAGTVLQLRKPVKKTLAKPKNITRPEDSGDEEEIRIEFK
jgi:LysM repeat protein